MTLDASSPKWDAILKGTIALPLKSLPLKLKLNALKMGVKTGKKNSRDAIQELLKYCEKNGRMFEHDLKVIARML